MSMISHELRSPITVILGAANLMNDKRLKLDGEAAKDLLADLQRGAARIKRITEEFLALARSDSRQEPELEPVLLQRVIEAFVALPGICSADRKIALEIDRDLEPVRASPGAIEQILRNLLDNADKYSPRGESITVRAARRGVSEVVISVLDRGPGVPTQEMDAIFDKFYRCPELSGSIPGLGIGLTVCKRLVEAQQGQIWVRPREGGGLDLSFSLSTYGD